MSAKTRTLLQCLRTHMEEASRPPTLAPHYKILKVRLAKAARDPRIKEAKQVPPRPGGRGKLPEVVACVVMRPERSNWCKALS